MGGPKQQWIQYEASEALASGPPFLIHALQGPPPCEFTRKIFELLKTYCSVLSASLTCSVYFHITFISIYALRNQNAQTIFLIEFNYVSYISIYALRALWGATPNAQLSRLKTIQNKIIKIIGGGEWRERATPYYLQLDILKLDDVYKLEVGKLMFHNNKNNLPKPFEGYFTEAGMNHLHQTRASSQKLLKVCRFSKSRYQQSFKYQGVSIWNSIPNNIKQHSFFSFKKKYKKMLIDSYNQ